MRRGILKRLGVCLLGTALFLTQQGCKTVTGATEVLSTKKTGIIQITNGGFENGLDGWVSEPKPATFESKGDAGSAGAGSNALNFWNETDINFKCTQIIKSIPAGTYRVTALCRTD